MSNQAINAVLYCSKSKGASRLVLMLVADGTNSDTECFAPKQGLSKIAQLANCSERSVQRQFPSLIGLGELVIEDRIGRTSLYYIPILEGEEGFEPLECHDDSHTCNGYHTPLNRRRHDIRVDSVSRRRAAQRKTYPQNPRQDRHPSPPTRSSPPDPGVTVSSPPPDNSVTPPRQDRHPSPDKIVTPRSYITQRNPDLPNMTQAALSIDKASPEPPEPDEGTPRPRHGEPPSWAELMRWRTSPGGRQWMCALGIDANTRSETALLFAWREYERVRQQENARRGELPQLAQATRLPEHLMTIGAAP